MGQRSLLAAGLAALFALTACQPAIDPGPMVSGPAPAGGFGRSVPGISLDLPAVDPTRFANEDPNPWTAVAEQPQSTLSLSSDTTSYGVARKILRERAEWPPAPAVRPEEFVNSFSYSYPRATRSDPLRPSVEVVPAPWNSDHRLMVVGMRTYEPPRATRPPLNLVLLVDSSGSMRWEDRLPLIRRALSMMLDNLSARDRVSLVTYAGSSAVLLDSVTGDQRQQIEAALASIEAAGSTAGAQGLTTAYELARKNFDPRAVNRVVLATDGDFNVGLSDPQGLGDWITEQRKTGIYLTTMLVGLDNVNDRTVHALAKAGNGISIFAGDVEEARRGLVDDFAANIVPVANDVKMQVEFNPANVARYRLIGYETRLLRREDFANDRVDAGEIGSGRSITAVYEIVPARPSSSQPPVRTAGPNLSNPGRALRPGEIAVVSARFKLPGSNRGQLRMSTVRTSAAHRSFEGSPAETRFAVAVAGFAEVMRRSPHVNWELEEIATVAGAAAGPDPDGRRADFIRLVRLAATLKSSRP